MRLNEIEPGVFAIEGGPLDGTGMRLERVRPEREDPWRPAKSGKLTPVDGDTPWHVWTDAPDFDSHHECDDPRVDIESYLSREIIARMLEHANQLPSLSRSVEREIEIMRPKRDFPWPKRVERWPDGAWVDIDEHEVWVLPEYLHQKRRGGRGVVVADPGAMACLARALEGGPTLEGVALTRWRRELRGHEWYKALPEVVRVGLPARTRKRHEDARGVHRVGRLSIEVESERGDDIETRRKVRTGTAHYLMGTRALLAAPAAAVDVDTVKPLVQSALAERNRRQHYERVAHDDEAAWNATAALLGDTASEDDRSALEEELRRRVAPGVPPNLRLELRLVEAEEAHE